MDEIVTPIKFNEITEENRSLTRNKNVYDSLSEEEKDSMNETEPFSLIIDSSSRIAVLWDYTMLFLIMYSLLIEPYRTAFYASDELFWVCLSLIIDCCFLIDLILNFFKPYKEGNDLITDNRKIARNYLLGHFSLDLLASFPFELLELAVNMEDRIGGFARIGRLYRLSKLFKLLRFKRFFKIQEGTLSDFKLLQSIEIRRLFKILAIFLLLMHISACFMCFLGNLFLLVDDTWISASGLTDYPPSIIYIHAVYFSLTTILGVGYGDIVTVNMSEKVFNIVFNFISALFFSYTISSFSKMFYKLDEKAVTLQKNMEIFRQLTEDYKINREMQKKIKDTLHHTVKHSHLEKYNFVESLPSSIRNKLVFLMHKRYIGTLLFTKGRTHEFITAALPLLKRPLFKYRESLIKVGDFFDEIYLVVKGKVRVNMGQSYNHFEIGMVGRDEHFGDVLLYLSQQSPYELMVKSRESDILTLGNADFFFLLNHMAVEMHHILEKSIEKMEKLETRRKVVMELHDLAEDKEQLKKAIEVLTIALLKYDIMTGESIEIDQLVGQTNRKKYREVMQFIKEHHYKELESFFPYLDYKGKKTLLTGFSMDKNSSIKSDNSYGVLAKKILDFSMKSEKMDYLDVHRNTTQSPQTKTSWKKSKLDLGTLKTAIRTNSEIKENKSKLSDFVSKSKTLLGESFNRIVDAFGTKKKEEMVKTLYPSKKTTAEKSSSVAALIGDDLDPNMVTRKKVRFPQVKDTQKTDKTFSFAANSKVTDSAEESKREEKLIKETGKVNKKLDNLGKYIENLVKH